MAGITDYTSLKSELSNFLHRTDLSTEYDTWIGLVESELNLELRLRNQLSTTTLTATSETVSLPSDFLQIRNLEISATPVVPLKYVTSEQKDFYDLKAATGQPRLYTITGSNLILAPVPDGTYTLSLEYYATIPSLVSNTTNWLCTNYPHVYLYGCLAQAGAFLSDAERVQRFVVAYQDAKEKLNRSDDNSMYDSSPRVRPDVCW